MLSNLLREFNCAVVDVDDDDESEESVDADFADGRLEAHISLI